MQLEIKYGCDGSSGYTPFMEKLTYEEEKEEEEEEDNMESSADDDINETTLFLMSFVPLHLSCQYFKVRLRLELTFKSQISH